MFKEKTKEIMISFYIFIYSLVIRFVCSYNSPIFDDSSIVSDNAVFYMIGKALLEGKVLYKDIFDHKPPYIYFLNALCSILSYRHIGLFICDVFFTFLFLFFIYKILGLYSNDNKKNIIVIIFSGFIFNFGYISDGMCRTETISLALLMIVVYLFIKYYKDFDVKKDFDIKAMFVIGIVAGNILMFSLKTPLLLIPFIIITIYILLKNKLYKNIINLFFAGLIGVFLAILPYIIYMIYTKSFSDMLYDLYYVNMIYADSASNIGAIKTNIFSSVLSWPKTYLPFFVLTAISFLTMLFLKYDRYIKFVSVISFLILFYYTFSVNRTHPYYLQMFVPYFALFFYLFIDRSNIKKILTKTFLIFTLVITFILNLYYGSIDIFYNYGYYKDTNIALNKLIDENGIKKNKVLSLGFNAEPYIYLDSKYNFKYQIVPVIKYDYLSKPYEEQLEYIKNAEPDIVVFPKDKYMYHLTMQKYNEYLLALAKNYHPIGKIDTYDKDEPYVIFVKE